MVRGVEGRAAPAACARQQLGMRKKTTAQGYERRIKPPYAVELRRGSWFLVDNCSRKKHILKKLIAESDDGRDREACSFLGIRIGTD